MMDKRSLVDVIELEVRLHPGLEPVDLYKLIFQSVLGADHMLASASREKAESCLLREWFSEEPSEDDGPAPPPFQVIDPAAGVVRLHLRTLRRMRIDPESVVEAVLEQPLKGGRPGDVAELWRMLLENIADLPGLPDPGRIASFNAPEGSPHHSRAYGPASYRILNNWSRLGLLGFLRCNPSG